MQLDTGPVVRETERTIGYSNDCMAPGTPYEEFEYLKREASHVVNNWIKLEMSFPSMIYGAFFSATIQTSELSERQVTQSRLIR